MYAFTFFITDELDKKSLNCLTSNLYQIHDYNTCLSLIDALILLVLLNEHLRIML